MAQSVNELEWPDLEAGPISGDHCIVILKQAFSWKPWINPRQYKINNVIYIYYLYTITKGKIPQIRLTVTIVSSTLSVSDDLFNKKIGHRSFESNCFLELGIRLGRYSGRAFQNINKLHLDNFFYQNQTDVRYTKRT